MQFKKANSHQLTAVVIYINNIQLLCVCLFHSWNCIFKAILIYFFQITDQMLRSVLVKTEFE